MKLYDAEVHLLPDESDIMYECPECGGKYHIEVSAEYNAHLQYDPESEAFFVCCYGCQHYEDYEDIDGHTNITPIRIPENYIEALRPTSWLATKVTELRLNAVSPTAFSFI